MNSKRLMYLICLLIVPPHLPTLAVVNQAGLKIINDTNQHVRIHVSTDYGTDLRDLSPRQEYLFSVAPNNLAVYMQNGSGSLFEGIKMHPVFDKLVIRTNPVNPRCAIIGYYGQTREREPKPFSGPIVFPPNTCHIKAWNPNNGNIYTGSQNEPPIPRSYQPGTIYSNQ